MFLRKKRPGHSTPAKHLEPQPAVTKQTEAESEEHAKKTACGEYFAGLVSCGKIRLSEVPRLFRLDLEGPFERYYQCALRISRTENEERMEEDMVVIQEDICHTPVLSPVKEPLFRIWHSYRDALEQMLNPQAQQEEAPTKPIKKRKKASVQDELLASEELLPADAPWEEDPGQKRACYEYLNELLLWNKLRLSDIPKCLRMDDDSSAYYYALRVSRALGPERLREDLAVLEDDILHLSFTNPMVEALFRIWFNYKEDLEWVLKEGEMKWVKKDEDHSLRRLRSEQGKVPDRSGT